MNENLLLFFILVRKLPFGNKKIFSNGAKETQNSLSFQREDIENDEKIFKLKQFIIVKIIFDEIII